MTPPSDPVGSDFKRRLNAAPPRISVEANRNEDFKRWWNGEGDPVREIEQRQFALKKMYGKWPTGLVMSRDLFWALVTHEQVRIRVRYTVPGPSLESLIASVLAPPDAGRNTVGLSNYRIRIESSATCLYHDTCVGLLTADEIDERFAVFGEEL